MADINDPQNFRQTLHKQRRILDESTEVHEIDRGAIQRWIKRRDGSVKISTLGTYLRRVRAASERSSVPLVEMSEDDFHDLVFSLRHDHDLSPATIKNYENSVLLFLDDVLEAEWPEDVERTTVERNRLHPDEVLNADDIAKLTETARHQRDVAFIEFLADTGARLSLTLSLRVRDVEFGTLATYQPNSNAIGLKDAAVTEYPLIDSKAPIQAYLRTSHPRPTEPDVALFHKLKPSKRGPDGERWTDDGSVVPNAANQQLKRIADRAGIDKPVKPHAFRHAAITRMVREGYSRSQIEHRVHWTLDTDMWQTYEHIASTEHNEDIFRQAGLLSESDGPNAVRKECGNCNEPLAPHHDFCGNCGQPATPGAAKTSESAEGSILDLMVEEANPSTRRELQTLLEKIRDDPSLSNDHEDPSD